MRVSYQGLFGRSEIRHLIAASLAARLSIASSMLPLVLTVGRSSGSFAVAGVAAGAFSVAVALSAPLRGRSVDTRGSRRALPPMTVLSASCLILIALAAGARAPNWLLVSLAGLAGATTPPLVAAMRLEWQRLLGIADPRLPEAYAFESAAQTAVFVVGPLLAGVTIEAIGPARSLGSAAIVLLISTCAFARIAHAQPASSETGLRSGVWSRGLLTLVLLTALTDTEIGAVNILVPALSNRNGHAAVAGPLLAAFAFGSVAGALVYGSRSWNSRPTVQLLALTSLSAGTVPLLALPVPMYVLGLLLSVVGVPIGALWAATSVALDLTPGGGNAESFTWLTVANGVGIATGSVIVGAVADHWNASAAFLLASAAPAAAMMVLWARRSTISVDRPHL